MKNFNSFSKKKYKRLHPVSMIYFIIKTLKDLYELLLLIPVIVLAAPKLFSGIGRLTLIIILIACAIMLLVIISWIRWINFRYYANNRGISIKYGIFSKNETWIPVKRIQSIDITERLYDRVFGLVQLQIETAGGSGKAEAILSSISIQEAHLIRTMLGFENAAFAQEVSAKNPTETENNTENTCEKQFNKEQFESPQKMQQRISYKELFISSLVSNKFWGLIIAIFVIFSRFDLESNLLNSDLSELYIQFGPGLIALSIILIIAVLWLASLLVAFISYYGFTIVVNDGKLVIERGLLERKIVTIPLERIQAIHLIEHSLYRIFGVVDVKAVITGYTEKDENSVTLYPTVREQHIVEFLSRFASSFSLPDTWKGLEPIAWRSVVMAPSLYCLIIAAPIAIYLHVLHLYYGWLLLLLPAFVMFLRTISYRQTGWAIVGKHIAIRYGSLSCYRVLIPKHRIQWCQISQTPFQKLRNLANFRVSVASGKGAANFNLRCALETEAQKLFDWSRPKWSA
jgi:putative membrane protein